MQRETALLSGFYSLLPTPCSLLPAPCYNHQQLYLSPNYSN
ncbi:hypothetical protein [Moorena sp. SIO4G3]|nr:hypothetical protein [Moorena sp. SIO4G3]